MNGVIYMRGETGMVRVSKTNNNTTWNKMTKLLILLELKELPRAFEWLRVSGYLMGETAMLLG